MKKLVLFIVIVLVILALIVWLEPSGTARGWLRGEKFFQSRPTQYWIKALTSPEPSVSSKTENKLAAGGANSAAVLDEILRSQQGNDPDDVELRWKAAELLGKVGPDAKPYSQTLLNALNDPDPHVRTVAAASLPKVDAPADAAVPALTKLMDRDLNVRVARALSEYGPDAAPALPALMKILSDKKLDSELRWNAARTIGKMHEKGAPAIPVLIEALRDETPTVREHAAEHLGDIGPDAREAADDLMAVLSDSYWRVRRDAARSLGQIGESSPELMAALRKLLEDENENVRNAAQRAIEALTSTEASVR